MSTISIIKNREHIGLPILNFFCYHLGRHLWSFWSGAGACPVSNIQREFESSKRVRKGPYVRLFRYSSTTEPHQWIGNIKDFGAVLAVPLKLQVNREGNMRLGNKNALRTTKKALVDPALSRAAVAFQVRGWCISAARHFAERFGSRSRSRSTEQRTSVSHSLCSSNSLHWIQLVIQYVQWIALAG